jgi:hypothetical protein
MRFPDSSIVPPSSPQTVKLRRGTAIRRTPQPTIARSVISTFRGSLSPILMAPPVWRSCEFDLRTNPSFRPLWPLLGHPARAPRRSLELVRAHARRHHSGFARAPRTEPLVVAGLALWNLKLPAHASRKPGAACHGPASPGTLLVTSGRSAIEAESLITRPWGP